MNSPEQAISIPFQKTYMQDSPPIISKSIWRTPSNVYAPPLSSHSENGNSGFWTQCKILPGEKSIGSTTLPGMQVNQLFACGSQKTDPSSILTEEKNLTLCSCLDHHIEPCLWTYQKPVNQNACLTPSLSPLSPECGRHQNIPESWLEDQNQQQQLYSPTCYPTSPNLLPTDGELFML